LHVKQLDSMKAAAQMRQRPEAFRFRGVADTPDRDAVARGLLAAIRFDENLAVLEMQLQRTIPLATHRSLRRAQPGTERNEQGLLSGGFHERLSG
jgi:hypothetical protein